MTASEVREPEPPADERLMTFKSYVAEFGVPLGTARRQVRSIEGLAWRVRGKVMVDRAKAAEINRPRPLWRGAKGMEANG